MAVFLHASRFRNRGPVGNRWRSEDFILAAEQTPREAQRLLNKKADGLTSTTPVPQEVCVMSADL